VSEKTRIVSRKAASSSTVTRPFLWFTCFAAAGLLDVCCGIIMALYYIFPAPGFRQNRLKNLLTGGLKPALYQDFSMCTGNNVRA